ncbi:MAG: FTR1 family protein [bacterium]
MIETFLITLREGLEAALIVGIILTFVYKIGARDFARHAWIGVASAIVCSVVLAIIFKITLGEFEDTKPEMLFEGVLMLVAAGVLTHMVIWMHRQARFLRGTLESQIRSAVTRRDGMGLAILAFVAVVREGVETVLFFEALGVQGEGTLSWFGGFLGLAGAIAIAVLFFRGTRVLDLRKFFLVTGVLVLLIAAGLFSSGLHELQEAEWLPEFGEHVYNLTNFLPDEEGVGAVLKSLFGYSASPSGLQFGAYLGYFVVLLGYLKWSGTKGPEQVRAQRG